MRHLVILLVLGCGSSSRSSTTPDRPTETPAEAAQREAREARTKQRREIDAAKPKSPYELRDKQGFAPPDRCGQGPYHFETDALKAPYGEAITVYACGKRIVGNYRITESRKGQASDSAERTFGYEADNTACKGHPIAMLARGPSTGARGGSGTAGGTSAAASPAPLASRALARTAKIPTDCRLTSIVSYGWESGSEAPAFDGKLAFDVWSELPNDLEDLVFVIERHAVVAGMTPARWKAYREAYNAWYAIYEAHHAKERAAGDWHTVDASVTTPPPPTPRTETPPPRPSQHARWIPGYWHYADAKFHWLAGLWDVPEEDVQRELTVQAPTPPPVRNPSDAPIEPRPTVTAVWTPGSWAWDGRTYVWYAGTWRIPPGAQHTWQAPTWTVRTGRSIYIPGGWRVRRGR